MPERWELILQFDDRSESFALGFEAGRIYERDYPCSEWDIAHVENRALIHRIAHLHGYRAEIRDIADYPGWIEWRFLTDRGEES